MEEKISKKEKQQNKQKGKGKNLKKIRENKIVEAKERD